MKTIKYIVYIWMALALTLLATACSTEPQSCESTCFNVLYAEKIQNTSVELHLLNECGFEETYVSTEPFELVNYDRFNLNVTRICAEDLYNLNYFRK